MHAITIVIPIKYKLWVSFSSLQYILFYISPSVCIHGIGRAKYTSVLHGSPWSTSRHPTPVLHANDTAAQPRFRSRISSLEISCIYDHVRGNPRSKPGLSCSLIVSVVLHRDVVHRVRARVKLLLVPWRDETSMLCFVAPADSSGCPRVLQAQELSDIIGFDVI